MNTPSTQWSERIAAGEEQQLAEFATAITELQRSMSERFGRGRAFHRKPIAALRASLEIAADLPEYARQGLFAKPGRYDVFVRLSNGSLRPQKNSEPDIRGFAMSIQGVEGESALGGPATTQDFLLINREVFGFTDLRPFVDLAIASSKGPLAIISLFIRTYGFFRGLSEVRKLLGSIRKPFTGFLTEPFFSCVPVAWGPYAARLRIQPTGAPRPAAVPDVRDEVFAYLAEKPSVHALQAQFYVDERVTPIEDGAANWDEVCAPYITVATLTIAGQSREESLAADVEERSFDPWHALAAHRPLGHVMRARKASYFASQQARKKPEI